MIRRVDATLTNEGLGDEEEIVDTNDSKRRKLNGYERSGEMNVEMLLAKKISDSALLDDEKEDILQLTTTLVKEKDELSANEKANS